MTKDRPGINALTGLLVVVIIIAVAFYVTIPMMGSPSSTGSSATISTGNTSTTSSKSSAPSTTGTLTISSSQPLIVAPDVNESVTLALSAIGTVSGNYTFSATALPQGVAATFKPSAVSLPAQLTSGVTVTLSAASGAAIANATVNIVATNGPSVFTQPFSLQSVPALVLIQGNAFHPSSLTVAAGTKVYWLNLDAAGGGDVALDAHDVTALDHSFSSGNGNLQQYAIYGHAFATAGTVQYESAAQGASMTGQVVVTG